MLQPRSHDVPVLRRKKFNTSACMNLENRLYIFIICKTGPSLLNKGNAYLKIAPYRFILQGEMRCSLQKLRRLMLAATRLRHVERIFNRSELHELFAWRYPRSVRNARPRVLRLPLARRREASHNLHIGCLSGTCEKVQTMGERRSRLAAHSHFIPNERIAYVPETTYIRSHESDDPRIDTNVRNVIHTGCA